MKIKIPISDVGGFTGESEVEIKSFDERLDMINKFTMTVTPDGAESSGAIQAKQIYAIVKENVHSVKLKHSEGVEVNSVEELEIYAEGLAVIQHLGSIVMNGVKLSKN